jgi:AbrB family looped-hinge helix DNA binding protein
MTEVRTLKVDEKGRLQIPREVRERLGIKKSVTARIEENGSLSIEPASNLYDKLASDVTFNFRSVEKSLPDLRKTAEKQLFKEGRPKV